MRRWIPWVLVGMVLGAVLWRLLVVRHESAVPPETTSAADYPPPSFALTRTAETTLAPGLTLFEGTYHGDTFHLCVAHLSGFVVRHESAVPADGRPEQEVKDRAVPRDATPVADYKLRVQTVTRGREGVSVRKVALETGALVALNGTFYDYEPFVVRHESAVVGPQQYRNFVTCGAVWEADPAGSPARNRGRLIRKRRWFWAVRQQEVEGLAPLSGSGRGRGRGDDVRFWVGPEEPQFVVKHGSAVPSGTFGLPKAVQRAEPTAGLGGLCGLIRDGATIVSDERGHFTYPPGLDDGHARSALGYTRSGRLLLVTADHRWTWRDTQQFFLEATPALLHEDIDGAVLLDGGSASHCWIYAPSRAPDRTLPPDHPLTLVSDPRRHFGYCQVNRGGGFAMQNWRNASFILITDDHAEQRRQVVAGDPSSWE